MGVCGGVLGEEDVLMREELTIKKKTLASQNSREEPCKGHLIRWQLLKGKAQEKEDFREGRGLAGGEEPW